MKKMALKVKHWMNGLNKDRCIACLLCVSLLMACGCVSLLLLIVWILAEVIPLTYSLLIIIALILLGFTYEIYKKIS